MSKKDGEHQLNNILEKAMNRQLLSKMETVRLLSLKEEHEVERLFATARSLRHRYFDNKIFHYGFVYFSTYCRNNCNFCFYREANNISYRYRKSEAEILEAAQGLAEIGVHLIDLTMGEDPFYKKNRFKAVGELVGKIKKVTNLPVMVSPGLVGGQAMGRFSLAGADWFACYQETHNRELFRKLRPKQSYDRRLISKKFAAQTGMLIEEGILTGVGETLEDIAVSMENMRDLGAHQVRIMTFVPQAGIPMVEKTAAIHIKEATVIAVLRLLFPDRLIPASLDVDGIAGLQERLNAGANVVTSLIPPEMGLAGVAQCTKDINVGNRTVQRVALVLEQMGLRVAALEEYVEWINMEKQKLKVPYQSGNRWRI